ncbi:MAG: hypothetical protein M1821_009291 [Bathelium mastoideum]|nr:MAG: hypothetical protein M1821_009291 [Bathelium mastoideum]
MPTKDSSLYGIPRPKKPSTGREISSSSSLAFSSHLSSLIASPTPRNSPSSTTNSGRSRPKKDSIFTTHNKGSLKRAHADISTSSPAFEQKHSTTSDTVDPAEWRRAQRRMEDKARLYAAMKRGDVEDSDDRHLIDFDRKWAEREAQGLAAGEDESTSSDDGAGSDEEQELVEYVDEFGRTRTGTKAEAARQERMARGSAVHETERDRFTARPAAPASGVIRGDTIQAAAFDPDEPIAVQMAALAAKRDREATPPPDEHYNGAAEVRTKGTGFFQFSRDEEERKEQMAGLEEERRETERKRAEREERREARKREVEERRRVIGERRGRKQADAFLEKLGEEMFGKREEVSGEKQGAGTEELVGGRDHGEEG